MPEKTIYDFPVVHSFSSNGYIFDKRRGVDPTNDGMDTCILSERTTGAHVAWNAARGAGKAMSTLLAILKRGTGVNDG